MKSVMRETQCRFMIALPPVTVCGRWRVWCVRCKVSFYNSPAPGVCLRQMESLVREMQSSETGVPVRSQKLFLTTIPSAFTGEKRGFLKHT